MPYGTGYPLPQRACVTIAGGIPRRISGRPSGALARADAVRAIAPARSRPRAICAKIVDRAEVGQQSGRISPVCSIEETGRVWPSNTIPPSSLKAMPPIQVRP